MLSLPAMSLDLERAFFTAKITFLDRRNKIGIYMLKYLECLKSWTGPLKWEIEVRDIKVQKNKVLIGPRVLEAIRDTVKAI